ncbi:MAG: SDR family NAD(P)-dependent oxidoreductase [Bacillota bacterium]
MKFYKGKIVYITGGSSGIGLEMAKLLASYGSDIIIMARNKNKLDKACREIQKHCLTNTQRVASMPLDAANNPDVQEKMKQAVELYGCPDILINSAGIAKYANCFNSISYDNFDEVIKTNLYGVRNVTHALLNPMKEKKGHVVIISSVAGLFGMYGYTAYGTSKAALIVFAESLRYELKPHGMAVTVVCPPEVETPLIVEERDTLPKEGRAVKNLAGLLKPEFVAKYVLRAVAKRKFFVIPGFTTRFLYTMHRLTNGKISRFTADYIIKRTAAKNPPV